MSKKIVWLRNSIVPMLGESGLFKMEMFRGIDDDIQEENGFKYASDPGDYGRGEYWARDKSFARIYGKVVSKTIRLSNALHLSSNDIVVLARDIYGTTINRGKGHCCFKAAEQLTNEMLIKGYDGIVIYGYERQNMWSACVFKP